MTASKVVPVSTGSPPITIGTCDALAGHVLETHAKLCSFGRPGLVPHDRLVDRGRGTEDAGGAHPADCILVGVGVTRHTYDVPGWGVGEVWARDGLIIQHELACEELHHSQVLASESRSRAPPTTPRGHNPERGGRPPGPGAAKPSSASPDGGAEVPARTLPPHLSHGCDDSVPDLCRRIIAHLTGIPTTYEGVAIDLEWATPLQHELAAAARAIPWGEVVSYGELAALAGRPRAARAAGSFCADNRFSLIIPCHRVVAADGIGGYGAAGPGLKRRLLALEDVQL